MSPRSARRDRWSAAGLAILALGYLAAARRYPLDTLATPGPGIFPLAAGLALLGLAVGQLVTARPAMVGGGVLARGPLIMALVLALYAAVFPVLGFVPSSLALVFLAARLMGLGGWWRPGLLALGVTLVSRVLFGTWLGVPLP